MALFRYKTLSDNDKQNQGNESNFGNDPEVRVMRESEFIQEFIKHPNHPDWTKLDLI